MKCQYCNKLLKFEWPWPWKHFVSTRMDIQRRDVKSIAHCKCGWLYAEFKRQKVAVAEVPKEEWMDKLRREMSDNLDVIDFVAGKNKKN